MQKRKVCVAFNSGFHDCEHVREVVEHIRMYDNDASVVHIWNDLQTVIFPYDAATEVHVAPIIRIAEDGDIDNSTILVMVEKDLHDITALKTNITRLLQRIDPCVILILARSMGDNVLRELEAEFPYIVRQKFIYATWSTLCKN